MTALRGRFALALAGVVFGTLLFSPAAFAVESPSDPSSGELVEQPKSYDGRAVTFEGEAVGEVLKRGDHAWLHLNDDAYMYENVEEGAPLDGYNSGMPVWVPVAMAGRVGTLGDYKHEGDVVRVEGTFNAACREHGGDMDIHATQLVVVTPGHPAADPIRTWKVLLAAGLTMLAAAFWLLDRMLSRRERSGLLKLG